MITYDEAKKLSEEWQNGEITRHIKVGKSAIRRIRQIRKAALQK